MTRPLPFTLDDHHANPLRFPTCHDGCVWKQRGNYTGHCAGCHETFEGIKLFDAHQGIRDDGSTICYDPTSMELDGKPLVHREGSWRRDAPMPQDASEALGRAR